jgi:MFS superfamily sulfate permease-like transporter
MSTSTPRSTQKPALVVRWVPALAWLRSYQPIWLRGDAVAGLTAAAVVVPQAMAYGDIAGLPLVVGLYTALVPLIVYAVMGTSLPLSVTTTSTIAILTAGALHQVAPNGANEALVAGAATLTEAENKLQQSGVSLWLAGLNPERLELVQKSALGKIIGCSRMHCNLEQAVESYQKQK